MPTSKTNLVSYATRDVVTGRGPGKITEFNSIEGIKFSTWNAALASQVKAMLNQPVIVEYEVKQNAGFTNHYLISVHTVDEVLETEDTSVVDQTLVPLSRTLDKDTQIAKAVALKAAVDTPLKFSNPQEVIALAKVYEGYLTSA